MSIKERVKFTDWDSSMEIVNGQSSEAKAINHAIENTRFLIRENYRELEYAHSLITAESIKNPYLGIQQDKIGHRRCELLHYYESIWS